MRHVRVIAAVLGVVAVPVAAAVGYRTVFQPWQARWGATDEEVDRVMPGDAVVADPDFVATRAIDIDAAPERVWPWLVQVGSGRAGWYTYDRIDNGGTPSADRILPEQQQLRIGDRIPMVPGRDVGPIVADIDPPRRMLWTDDSVGFSWEWQLDPVGDRTRLVSRLRVNAHPWSRRMVYEGVAAVGDIFMQRRMLRGIKRRAEHTAAAG